jgi:hypothetical protein
VRLMVAPGLVPMLPLFYLCLNCPDLGIDFYALKQARFCAWCSSLLVVLSESVQVVWIDRNAEDELDILMELENAEKLWRYALSRGFVDANTWALSSAHIKVALLPRVFPVLLSRGFVDANTWALSSAHIKVALLPRVFPVLLLRVQTSRCFSCLCYVS